MSAAISIAVPVREVTRGPRHHFFGYYDKQQWDAGGRYLLALETEFADRLPRPKDVARIGIVDTSSAWEFRAVASSRSWCWQKGCMAQWLPRSRDTIAYNDRVGDRFVGRLLHLHSGSSRTLPRPVYAITSDERWCASVNFARLHSSRHPETGYAGLVDPWAHDGHPVEDGIFLMELETGNHDLVVTLDHLASLEPTSTMEAASHYVTHLLFNPRGDRLAFWHRWEGPCGRGERVYTVNPDGTDLHRVRIDRSSHTIWKDNTSLVIWGAVGDGQAGFYVFQDRTQTRPQVLGGGVLGRNGHLSFSPDGRWAITDEYLDRRRVALVLYRTENQTRIDLGSVQTGDWKGDWKVRCDVHPRWNRAGDMICIESTHEGTRQMYVVDLRSLMDG